MAALPDREAEPRAWPSRISPPAQRLTPPNSSRTLESRVANPIARGRTRDLRREAGRSGGTAWPSRGQAWYAVFVFAVGPVREFPGMRILPPRRPISATTWLHGHARSAADGLRAFVMVLRDPRAADRASHRPQQPPADHRLGVALWSGATALCGLGTRHHCSSRGIGVGVGEACTGPATLLDAAGFVSAGTAASRRVVSPIRSSRNRPLGHPGGHRDRALEHLPPVTLRLIGLLKTVAAHVPGRGHSRPAGGAAHADGRRGRYGGTCRRGRHHRGSIPSAK